MNPTLMQTAMSDSAARLDQYAEPDRLALRLVLLRPVGFTGVGSHRVPEIPR